MAERHLGGVGGAREIVIGLEPICKFGRGALIGPQSSLILASRVRAPLSNIAFIRTALPRRPLRP